MRFIQLRPPGYSVLHLIHAPRHSSSSACGRLKMLHKGTSIGRSISRPVRYNHIRMHGCHQRPSAYQTIPIVSMRTLSIYDFCWNKAKKGILLYTNCKSALLQPTSGSRRVIQIDWSRWCDWVLLRSVIPQNERKRSCSQKKKKNQLSYFERSQHAQARNKLAPAKKHARLSRSIQCELSLCRRAELGMFWSAASRITLQWCVVIYVFAQVSPWLQMCNW
jgi:hypothetical protein